MFDFGFRAYLPLSLGRTVATPGAIDALAAAKVSPLALLARHAAGDWGVVCDDDAALNNDALIHGDRIMSVYVVGDSKVWIITEADRSVTTILLPSEY